MKCIAAVEADVNESPIGTKSRATVDLDGRPVLTRTLEQIARAQRVAHVFVLCPAEQVEACRGLIPPGLSGRVSVRPNRVSVAPFRNVVRTARKWSLDGYRGGVGGICSMDEYTRSDELALLAHEESADALFCASSSAPLLDPSLADTMIEYSEQSVEESRLTFAQAPPGLVGTVYRTDFLIELGQQHVPPGMVLCYKPDAPMMDLAHKTCCYTAPEAVRHACGRLIVDTDRAFETVHAYLSTGRPIEAEVVGRWLIERELGELPSLPREVEIELTTEDQLADTILRPRGSAVGRRGPIELAGVEKIAAELATYDDSLVVLGGFGEPLLHPRFDDIVQILREAGIYGIAVRTNALALTDDRIEAMIRHQVDIVSPLVDATTAELYVRVHGQDRFEEASARIRRLIEIRTERKVVAPLVVAEMVKSIETVGELDTFFDGWVREAGWATIAGYSHYAGQREDRGVMNMCPPSRCACRRIMWRATILADGRMLVCDQDFTGARAVGKIGESSLGELWRGGAMESVRRGHRAGRFEALDLCGRCEEWHRP